MTETPFFFTRGPARLFGFAHIPEFPEGDLGVVLSHPFGEEKLWSHRVYVSLARVLAQRGYPVLRFDYMGAGDSSGMTPDTSLTTHLEDLAAAVEELVIRVPGVERVALVGLRLGATIAALLAEQAACGNSHSSLQESPLVLFEPILDGESYLQELLRSNLSTQLAVYGKVQENRETLKERIRHGGTVNVDGYEIGRALFESCSRRDLLPAAGLIRHLGPTLVAQIASSDKQKDREDLQVFARAYAKGTFARVTEQPFWREIRQFYGRAGSLEETTLNWLEQTNV